MSARVSNNYDHNHNLDLRSNIHWWARLGIVMDQAYPCAKFGDFSFSRFGFTCGQTDTQTHRQNHRGGSTLYSRDYTVGLSNNACIKLHALFHGQLVSMYVRKQFIKCTLQKHILNCYATAPSLCRSHELSWPPQCHVRDTLAVTHHRPQMNYTASL